MMRSLAYTHAVCIAPQNIILLLRQPKFYAAFAISLPCGICGGALKFYVTEINPEMERVVDGIVTNQAVQSTLLFLVVLMAAFRIEAAYGKFWTGCDYVYNIVGDLFDGASDILSYTRCSKAPKKQVQEFQQLFIRLISLFNALIFAELEAGTERSNDGKLPSTYHFELLNIGGLDDASIEYLLSREHKVETVFTWIQFIVVEGLHAGIFSIPPPILTRGLSDISTALVHFHEAQKITEVPFPFPYLVALQLLMITHWLITPIVASSWTNYWYWTVAMSFVGTFSLWFFAGLAQELDQPFQHTKNSVDMRYLQRLLNNRVLCIVDQMAQKSPYLKDLEFGKTGSLKLTKQDYRSGEGKGTLETATTRLQSRVSKRKSVRLD